ncbi:MAG: tRNA epoxyqueuosine(34) reductase QueG [Sumerlaeia bacterium]
MPQEPYETFRTLELKTRELGFDLFGAAEVEPLEEELAHLKQWLAEGNQGEMDWLANDPEGRCDPGRIVPQCKRVLVVAKNYCPTPEEYNAEPTDEEGRVSRFALGKDYHRVFDKPLKKLARFCNRLAGKGSHSKPYVDHGPILERPWAQRAGLGFLGKHTLLINPEKGSWFFLGVVITTLDFPIPPKAELAASCGSCRRCIDACPTQAITEAPHRVIATRCLSYLNIEHEGPISDELKRQYGDWILGCDVCQEVCPYNLKRAEPTQGDPFHVRHNGTLNLVELLEMTEETFNERFLRSAFWRPGLEKIKQTAAIVQKNKSQKR